MKVWSKFWPSKGGLCLRHLPPLQTGIAYFVPLYFTVQARQNADYCMMDPHDHGILGSPIVIKACFLRQS